MTSASRAARAAGDREAADRDHERRVEQPQHGLVHGAQRRAGRASAGGRREHRGRGPDSTSSPLSSRRWRGTAPRRRARAARTSAAAAARRRRRTGPELRARGCPAPGRRSARGARPHVGDRRRLGVGAQAARREALPPLLERPARVPGMHGARVNWRRDHEEAGGARPQAARPRLRLRAPESRRRARARGPPQIAQADPRRHRQARGRKSSSSSSATAGAARSCTATAP